MFESTFPLWKLLLTDLIAIVSSDANGLANKYPFTVLFRLSDGYHQLFRSILISSAIVI